MFAGPLGRSTFTPPKSSFDSPLYGLVSLRRSPEGRDNREVQLLIPGVIGVSIRSRPEGRDNRG